MSSASEPANNSGLRRGAVTTRLEVFPGSQIVPPLLTPLEAVKLLRLDIITRPDGTTDERNPEDSLKTLDHLVRKGLLHPRRFGKSRCFSRRELLALIDGAPQPTNVGWRRRT